MYTYLHVHLLTYMCTYLDVYHLLCHWIFFHRLSVARECYFNESYELLLPTYLGKFAVTAGIGFPQVGLDHRPQIDFKSIKTFTAEAVKQT